MRLGIGSYTFYWSVGLPGYAPPRPLTAFDLLDAASELGVSVVQLCENLPLTALSPTDLDRFAAEAKSRGIDVEVGARGLDSENLRASLRMAARLGSPILRLVTHGIGEEVAEGEIVARLRALQPELRAAGVGLAIENTEKLPARSLARIVEALGTETVGVCIDTANSVGALERTEEVVETLAPYCVNVHLKDIAIRRLDYQTGFIVEGRPAGAGMLDVPAILGRLREHGRDPNTILEIWTPLGESVQATIERERQWARESIRYVRNLIAD